MTQKQQDLVYHHGHDFKGGRWVIVRKRIYWKMLGLEES